MSDKPHDYDKRVSEYIAKYTLEELFPQEYCDLRKTERPDFITKDRSVGVEVTRVIRKTEMEDADYYSKMLKGKDIKALTDKELAVFRLRGNELLTGDKIKPELRGRVIGYASSYEGTNYEGFKKAVVRKSKEYKDSYCFNCEICDLYVFWQELLEDEINNAFEVLEETVASCNYGFRYVFIDTNDYLFRCNITNRHIDQYQTRTLLKRIIKEARKAASESNCNL